MGRKKHKKKGGRSLCILRDIENQREIQPDFGKYMKSNEGNWINIEFCGKSLSKDTIETRKKLLLSMSNCLISKYLCEEVYISF